MNHLTPSNLPTVYWNLWQSMARCNPAKKAWFQDALPGWDWQYVLDAVQAVSRRLSDEDKAGLRASRIGEAITGVTYPRSRLANLSNVTLLVRTLEPSLFDMVSDGDLIDQFEAVEVVLDTLGASSHKHAKELEDKVFVVWNGQRVDPFSEVPGSDYKPYDRAEATARLNSLASRIGTHFLKSVWTILQAGLVVHVSTVFNLDRDKVEKSLRDYAEERGLL